MKYIDLRSDTVTWPTDEMRAAMSVAPVGDDVYGDDPTMLALEKLAANMLGKEAALFVPSGTMGNQIAIMTHTIRGDEVICSENAHIVVHEVGATAVLSGVCLRTLKTPGDRLTVQDIKKAVRPDDIHAPKTGLIEIENALANGTIMPLADMKEIYAFAKKNKIPVHLDGARIFNAATALGCTAKEIAQYADSVMFCLSKGLCAPVGSILAGSADFIEKARKNRKMLGGGMRQCGILAAAGMIAVEKMSTRLDTDHKNAKILAARLASIPGIELDEKTVQINMVFFAVNKPGFDHEGFVKKMKEQDILINAVDDGLYRFVTHYWVGEPELEKTVAAVGEILQG